MHKQGLSSKYRLLEVISEKKEFTADELIAAYGTAEPVLSEETIRDYLDQLVAIHFLICLDTHYKMNPGSKKDLGED